VSYQLLRGRVAVRMHEPKQEGLIKLPDQYYDNERERQHSEGSRTQASHTGRVLAAGEPARTPKGDAPIPHGFGVGDDVVVVFTHSEKNARVIWDDGEPCHLFPQANVLAIVEHDHERDA
jgi:co-chaperonin GroES (HSP10)